MDTKLTAKMKDRLNQLCKAVAANDMEQIEHHLDWLTVLHEIKVAEQLKDLKQMLDVAGSEDEQGNIIEASAQLSDAAERLKYILEETEKSANTSLDIADELSEGLHTLLEKADSDEDRALIQIMLKRTQDLVMAQEYQDLTGQILKRMIPALAEMNQILDTLVKATGTEKPSRNEDIMKGVGPNVTAKSKQDSVSSQDEVDDLLDSLGI
ncbi:chemotaxis protein CheZ [Sulfurivirga caldicuralii]|uniref:Protein phosphatase CheZ n=1 Tax=Sulfurivirga caldicuralii TaxID=364032 RepID=A0A1N6FKD2_9GAMM|nr:protein phosphatase CheZ [Sulfurivirga caldicuralii]SIN95763.1 chemotaxis protein CheZ [Sulfurivirga caldicuralii]